MLATLISLFLLLNTKVSLVRSAHAYGGGGRLLLDVEQELERCVALLFRNGAQTERRLLAPLERLRRLVQLEQTLCAFEQE